MIKKDELNVKALFRLLSKLSNVHRYSTNFLVKPESVLEHTGSVAILAASIGLFIRKYKDHTLNIELLLLKAILHDIEESETGDIPRTTKYHNSRILDGLMSFENESIDKIIKYTKIPNLHLFWSSSKQGPEGIIVSIADLMCVTYKLYEEIVKLNNYSLKDVGYESIKNYPIFMTKIDNCRKSKHINLITARYLKSVLNQSHKLAKEIIKKLEENE